MKLNKNQIRTIKIGLLLITASLISWTAFGGEIFTKTQVLIEKHDELFGTTYKEWKDKFVLGLDYTLGFIGIIFLFSSILFWIQGKRKK